MVINKLTDTFAVGPQIEPGDVAALAQAGYATIICNRPDVEVGPDHQAAAIAAAAESAGLAFVDNPISSMGLTPENVRLQGATADSAPGPVFAYCASGRRSSIAWSLSQAGRMSADDILAATTRAGYQLHDLPPHLEATTG
ncbi:MAG: TIGR01244 family phosphatase [Rhodobacteraceae bacterium]|nr:TIGR01244 family phosphatase [Paracoccaceae bacterium]